MAAGARKDGDRLPEERLVSELYGNARRDLPPAALDDKILAAARDAVGSSRPRNAWTKRWAVPISVAAVVVLSVGVVLRLSREAALEPVPPTPTTAQAPNAVPPATAEEAPSARYSDDRPLRSETEAKPATPSARRDQFEQRALDKSDALADNALQAKEAAKVAPSERTGAAPATNAAQAPSALAKEAEPRSDAERQKQFGAFKKNAPALSAQREEQSTRARSTSAALGDRANIVAVEISGKEGEYEFTVRIRGPNSGCAQYADWWEVLSEDGRLLYRQVLGYRPDAEQPLMRAGGPVPIAPSTVVWVRAHISGAGYGGAAFKGSIAGGFAATPLPADFAADLARRPPLPERCQP